MKNGKIIAIDGIDGSGKSTLAKRLSDDFDMIYFSVFEEKYMIKEMLCVADSLKKNYQNVFSERFINYAWMMDLFVGAHKKIEYLLKSGQNVVLDRYILSAKVYSLATTSSDISDCFDIYSLLPNPSVCIYLSVDVEEAVNRIKKREKRRTFYENIDGLSKISQKYKMMIHKEKEYPIEFINGNNAFEKVYHDCLLLLHKNDIIGEGIYK